MQGAVEQAAARPARDESILPPPTSFWARHEHALLGTISMLVFLAFWETSVDLGWVNPLFTSSPSRIVRTAIDMFADGSILVDMQVSGFEFIVGYGAAIVIGVPLGILMGWYSRVDAVLDPFVSALYATPRIALLPLVMIWFGIGLMSKVAIVVGEMYGATHGLGFLIATAGARFQTDKVMVGIIIIAAAGIVLTGLLRLIERRFERWRPSIGG
jgi:ABC-type nitrate/sulfonate/bicarbonate transport system permease component